MEDIEIRPINHFVDNEKAKKVVADAIEQFYESLIKGIEEISVDSILKNKNPYLYRARNMNTAQEIIQSVLEAHISSSEETIFGNLFFEPLAIAVSNGRKSMSEGVDLEVDIDGVRYVVAVKSGTSVFNQDGKKRQKENFEHCAALARQGGLALSPVIGYAYGAKRRTSSKLVLELAGQDFWEFLTGEADFYKTIAAYMDDKPEAYAHRFEESKVLTINRLTKDFTERFVKSDGTIDWNSILELNSGSVTRKEREELERIKTVCLAAIEANPMVTKKAMKETACCSSTKLNTALDALEKAGAVEKGYGGKARGWSLLVSRSDS